MIGEQFILLRINVGCGQSPTNGWVNFDNSWSVRLARSPLAWFFPGKSHYMTVVRRNDIRYAEACRLPVASGTADVVYSSHMLEHLDRQEALRFLAEAYRVLATGGRLRLVVPDLAKLAHDYARSGDADMFVSHLLMSQSRPAGLKAKLTHLLVGFREHRWMYDGPSLIRLISAAGFIDAEEISPGQTRIPSPGTLALDERADQSVFVEAVKP